MDDVQQIAVKEIMERLQEKIRKRQQEFSHTDPASALSNDPVAADLASLQSSYDIYHIHFTSHRKGLGRLVVLAKQVLRKLLTPILERQLAYNIANTRIADHLCEQVAGVLQQQAATSQALQEIVVEQVEGLYQAVRGMVVEQNEGLGQQQAAAFQTLRAAVMEQNEGLGQQQAAAFQTLRGAVTEQNEGLGQQQAAAFQTLRAAFQTLRAAVMEQNEELGQQQVAAFQTLRAVVVEQIEGLGQQQAAAVGALQKALFNSLQYRVNEVRDSVTESLRRSKRNSAGRNVHWPTRMHGLLSWKD